MPEKMSGDSLLVTAILIGGWPAELVDMRPKYAFYPIVASSPGYIVGGVAWGRGYCNSK